MRKTDIDTFHVCPAWPLPGRAATRAQGSGPRVGALNQTPAKWRESESPGETGHVSEESHHQTAPADPPPPTGSPWSFSVLLNPLQTCDMGEILLRVLQGSAWPYQDSRSESTQLEGRGARLTGQNGDKRGARLKPASSSSSWWGPPSTPSLPVLAFHQFKPSHSQIPINLSGVLKTFSWNFSQGPCNLTDLGSTNILCKGSESKSFKATLSP